MPRVLAKPYRPIFLIAVLVEIGLGQQALTWNELRDRFEATNPTPIAGRIGINESRSARPNPNATGLIDQLDPFTKLPSLNG
jgi:hypothetical protein